jgi:hypothetical protein
MRALVLDIEAKEKAEQVMAWARQHIFHPGEDPPPGDDPRHVCMLNTYRCAFSYTKKPETGALYRHLSISVPSDKFPHPEAVAMIAGLFEFSGAEQGVEARLAAGKWLIHIEEEEPHCIVLAEELRDEEAAQA